MACACLAFGKTAPLAQHPGESTAPLAAIALQIVPSELIHGYEDDQMRRCRVQLRRGAQQTRNEPDNRDTPKQLAGGKREGILRCHHCSVSVQCDTISH